MATKPNKNLVLILFLIFEKETNIDKIQIPWNILRNLKSLDCSVFIIDSCENGYSYVTIHQNFSEYSRGADIIKTR